MNACFRIVLALLLLSGFPATGARAGETPTTVRDFGPDDPGRDRWTDADGQPLKPGVLDPEYDDSLLMTATFPGSVEVWRGGPERPTALLRNGWLDRRASQIPEAFQFDIRVPDGLPPGIRVQARLALKNKDGLWFDALGQREARPGVWVPAQALHPGWNRVRVDLREDSVEVRPRGHGMAWSRFALSQVRALAILIQGDREGSGVFAIDNIVTPFADDIFADPARFVEFDPPDPGVLHPPGEMLRWRTGLNRPLLNPFRTSEVAVDVEITGPGRTEPFTLPAFFDIPHVRQRGADAPTAEPDTWTPTGPGRFEARYRPMEPGEYRWRMRALFVSPVSGVEERVESPEGVFRVRPWPAAAVAETATGTGTNGDAGMAPVAERARERGFVRVSRRDPRFFEFGNDEFFFPVGHSFRSPNDPRYVEKILRANPEWRNDPAPPDRDLRIYEELFPRMAAAGINACEVWMASWWLELEWTARWKNYHGLYGYNLVNAHRLDALLDLADAHGIYLHLTIDNHGKAAQSQRENDPEWPDSPLNIANRDLNGGFLEHAAEVFSDARARSLHKDKLRYIAARFGHSPRIFAWELWSELDLTGSTMRNRNHYAGAAVHAWHREMAEHLRRLDQGARPITTHYSGNFEVVDWTMFTQPFIDYAAFDAYADRGEPVIDLFRLSEAATQKNSPGKPFLLTEYGGGAYAATLPQLAAHQYAGLWWSWHSGTAGTPFYWWYELIVKADYYPAYRAFANYIAGEDKRRGPEDPPFVARWPADVVRDPPRKDNPLAVLAVADGNVYFAWVHDKNNLERLPTNRGLELQGVALRIGAMGEGAHRVEIWDAWEGVVLATLEEETADEKGILRVALPPFRSMIAVKVRALEPRDKEAIETVARPERLPPEE